MTLAGCSTGSDPDSSPAADGSAAGTFRLLISDQPVAISDFGELNVSFDQARIFSDGAGEVDEPDDGEETESEDEESEDDGTADGDQREFQVIDLDGATVDLTQVVGDKAISVFDGELEEGRYTKIELYAADVEGVVEGEPVDVMIPSGKLQIVKSFEVVAGESLSFVFDINVVKKGQGQEYNLLPVISESGVAGEDVEVEEVDTEATGAPNGTDATDEGGE